MATFLKAYPEFLVIEDSIKLAKDSFQYSYIPNFWLVIPELRSIAWEATQTARLTSELAFSCLYEIEGVYGIQRWVTNESNGIITSLLERDLNAIYNKMFLLRETLVPELIDRYDKTLQSLNQCL